MWEQWELTPPRHYYKWMIWGAQRRYFWSLIDSHLYHAVLCVASEPFDLLVLIYEKVSYVVHVNFERVNEHEAPWYGPWTLNMNNKLIWPLNQNSKYSTLTVTKTYWCGWNFLVNLFFHLNIFAYYVLTSAALTK